MGHASGLDLSPFNTDPQSPAVFCAAGQGPYANTRRALESIDLSPAQHRRVLLKPNAGRLAEPEMGITTHPQVVAAAIDAFRTAGAEVAVGESPISGVKALEALEVTGIADIARERQCPLIDLDALPYISVDIPQGVAIDSIKICQEVANYDLVVSLPVMKTHMHTVVTLAVKNMKGCLWRRSKVDLHMLPKQETSPDKSLNIAIADMASILRPHLSIIDGTMGMEGLGPSAGIPKPLDCVIVGIDPWAADAVACELMGIRAQDVPHLRIGAERGYGILDLKNIQVSPDHWQALASPFALPPENLSIEFPGVRILDKQSCSACQSTLLLFLKRYGDQLGDYLPEGQELVAAIGRGHGDLPAEALCIGNCTAKHKETGIFIPGCPPVASEIMKVLSEEKDRLDPDNE
jgi:uncharacterized protein (DUF362 family)